MNHKMNLLIIVGFWFTLFFICSPNIYSQWQVTINSPPGFDLYLEDLWSVDIINQEEQSVEITLFGEVFEEEKGQLFFGRSNTITIPPGGKHISRNEITNIYDEYYEPEFKRVLNQRGKFPSGNYTLCVTVNGIEGNEILGNNCIMHQVTMPAAVRLISPMDETSVTENQPIFQWTVPSPLPENALIKYHLKICEMYRLQTPYEAIENTPHYEDNNYTSTTLQYPVRAKAFEQGKHYVWQVQAVDESGYPVGENEGKSEIFRFQYTSIDSAFLIKIFPDTLEIGSFKIIVDEYTESSDSSLSGKGTGNFKTFSCLSRDLNPFEVIPAGISMITGIFTTTPFSVDFKDLGVSPLSTGKTKKIIKGKIEQNYNKPIRCPVDDFTVLIKKLVLMPDSSFANAAIELPTSSVIKYPSCKPATIDLGLINITSSCKMNKILGKVMIDSLLIGNTGILTNISGVEVNFTSSSNKVIFKTGNTISQFPTFPNNSNFLYGEYSFSDAELIGCGGLKAKLILRNDFTYTSIVPLNFHFKLQRGELNIEKSWIKNGTLTGEVILPKIGNTFRGDSIIASFNSVDVDSLLNLSGKVIFSGKDQELYWGGFSLMTDSASMFIPGVSNNFNLAPLDTSISKGFIPLNKQNIVNKIAILPGLTFNLVNSSQDTFKVYSKDVKKSIIFSYPNNYGWLNLSSKGFTGEIQSKEVGKLFDVKLGIRTNKKDYLSDSSFAADIWHNPDSLQWVDFKFVRNTVYDSYIGGYVVIPYPCDFQAKYKNLGITSTAEIVGGDIFFKDKKLKYWDVMMTADTAGNILSVRTGQIIYMNSSIKENVHFTKPFRIIWGEMFADGDLGKFLFDFNCAGQKFDGFPFTLHFAGLSKYDKSKPKKDALLGYLSAYGNVHFNFFGAKLIYINDYNDDRSGHDKKPFLHRFIVLNKDSSNLYFNRNWANSTAVMIFNIDYDENDQNGFVGTSKKQPMKVSLRFLSEKIAGTLNPSIIDLNSISSFIYFCCSDKEKGGPNIEILGDGFASMNSISGVIQIKGDAVKRIVLEGHSELKGWKFEEHSLASLDITPANVILRHKTQISFTFFSMGLMGLASTTLILDKNEGGLAGDLMGVFQAYGGNNYVIVQSEYMDLEIRGKLNFCLNPSVNYLQGYGKIKVKFGVELECEGAFFAGHKVPTDKIWALDQIIKGPSIREILKGQGKSELTGFYVAGSFSYTVTLVDIIEGGYTIWAGMGFFGPTALDKAKDVSITFLGHAGLELHGSVLGGVLSASAWSELLTSLTLPVNPLDIKLCMEGTLGIDACLAIFCASWSGTICISDAKGISTESCY